MYDWRTELQIRAEDTSYGEQTNKVCRSAIEELDRLRAQVDRLADGQLYQDKKITAQQSELAAKDAEIKRFQYRAKYDLTTLDEIEERDAEIEKLREALKAFEPVPTSRLSKAFNCSPGDVLRALNHTGFLYRQKVRATIGKGE